MAEPIFHALRARLAALRTRTELLQVSAADRATLASEIERLAHATETAAAELTAIRAELGALAERVAVPSGPVSSATAAAPTLRADHLAASTYRDRGWSLMAAGDRSGAIAALREALRLAPLDAEAEVMLGWALMLEDRLDEALATFGRVLSREPGHQMARVNLGYVCLRRRIFGEAIEHLTQVLRDGTDRKAALYANYYLGLVYFERAMYRDAQPFFRQALVLGPNLHEAAYDLGRALWFDGQESAARATWRQVVDAGPASPWAGRAAELLATVDAGGEVPRSRPS